MYTAFLLPLVAALVSVNASRINIPRTVSFVHMARRTVTPYTLMERGVLGVRQAATCTAGQAACTDGSCCDGSCCGDGCCPTGYTCGTAADGTSACCPDGQTCTGDATGCTDPTQVGCTGFDFCCPVGEACSVDANGAALCNGQPATGDATDTNTASGTTPGGTATDGATVIVPPSTTPPAVPNNNPPTTTHTTSHPPTTTHPTTTTPVPTTTTGGAGLGATVGMGGVAVVGVVMAMVL